MAEELLTLQKLCKYYTSPSSVVVGLSGIDLSFRAGEFVAITGESGSGKSTMAHVLAGILPYEGGELLYKGRPTSHYSAEDWELYRRDKVSFISQSYGILPGNTVMRNVTSALRLIGMDRASAARRAEEVLKQVELWELRHRRAAKLSSGQKQRLSIARALARPAPILIADEPTGNLDAENSAKIIRLLAEAAKSRLVILITHEFSECADYVTRHIAIHDGRVTMDKELRAPYEREEQPALLRKGGKKWLSFTTAGLQLSARPVWAGLMLLLFTLTVFAVFAFGGTFVANLDDTPTRYFDNSAFRNGDDRRIVVARADKGEMTEADYEALLSVRYVESLEPYSYLSDVQYAYREGVDYTATYTLEGTFAGGEVNYTRSEPSVSLVQEQMPFAKTVPLFPDGGDFLTAGRLPETMYEVVAVGGEELLGTRIKVYLQDQKRWSRSETLYLDCVVTGVTSYGSGLYFHDQVGQMLTTDIRGDGYILLYGDSYTVSLAPSNRSKTPSAESVEQLPVLLKGIKNEGGEATYLSGGRMPENRDEVVLVGDKGLLGTTLQVTIRSCQESGEGDSLVVERELTVVGVTEGDAGKTASLFFYPYFLEELLMTDREAAEFEGGAPENDPSLRGKYEMEIGLKKGELLLSSGVYKLTSDRHQKQQVFDLFLGTSGQTEEFRCVGHHDSTYSRAYMVTREDYEALAYHGWGDQVSLTMEDYAYTDRVMEAVRALGYAVISPYREGTTYQDPVRAEQRMQTLRVCLIAFLAALCLQVIVLRAMFSLETEGYRIMSHIGLSCTVAQRSVYLQIMLLTVCGQMVGLFAIWLCGELGVDRIQNVLKYLPASHWALLSLIHFIACMVTAAWTAKALKKQVFPDSGSVSDLDWDALEGEVEI